MPIVWPPLPDGEVPVWTGAGFEVAGRPSRVIRYHVGPSGWDDDLALRAHDHASRHRPIGQASRRHAIDEFRRWMRQTEAPVILDVGCGDGQTLRDLHFAFSGALLVGADYALSTLDRLAAEIPGIPFVQMDITQSPLPDAVFDGISVLNVLEHVEDDQAAIATLFRLLKPGGVAVIEVPAGPHLYDAFDKQMQHFRRYAIGSLLEKLTGARFEVLSRSHLGFLVYPAFWIGKKINRRKLKSSDADQRALQQAIWRSTKENVLLAMAFKLESGLRRIGYLPFGIRCLVTCRKPS